MRLQARVRGLQDIKTVTNSGQRQRLETLNELAQLQREKVRLEQEKENWQRKINLINTRLDQIAEPEKQLQRLREEDRALDDRTGGKERAREISTNTMTIRY